MMQKIRTVKLEKLGDELNRAIKNSHKIRNHKNFKKKKNEVHTKNGYREESTQVLRFDLLPFEFFDESTSLDWNTRIFGKNRQPIKNTMLTNP